MPKHVIFTIKASLPNDADTDLLAQSFQAVFSDFDPTELESIEESGIEVESVNCQDN